MDSCHGASVEIRGQLCQLDLFPPLLVFSDEQRCPGLHSLCLYTLRPLVGPLRPLVDPLRALVGLLSSLVKPEPSHQPTVDLIFHELDSE